MAIILFTMHDVEMAMFEKQRRSPGLGKNAAGADGLDSTRRHITALHRMELSTPIKLAIAKGYLSPSHSHLDYGCGTAGDVWRLRKLGYMTNGYDPFYFPENPIKKSDIVSLIYVLNVIEDIKERTAVLLKCWELAKERLIVAVRTGTAPEDVKLYKDGHVVTTGAFQKHYSQEEALGWLSDVLKIRPIPIASGVFVCNKSVKGSDS